jgi:acyl-coenzyme A thioesterase PaaI-like protein
MAPRDSTTRDAGHGARLLWLWARLSRLPLGRWLFSRLVGRTAPYSGTIGARVQTLGPGHAVLTMRDRRGVRNHLRSVHAIALANLGELASGLAAVATLPPGVRGIPVRISIEYHRKARGTLTARGSASFPAFEGSIRSPVHAVIEDASGEAVATVTVEWALERVGEGGA